MVVQAFPFNDFCNNLPGLSYSCSFQDYHRSYLELQAGRLRPTSLSESRTWFRNRSTLFGLVENAVDPGWSDPLGLVGPQPGDSFDPRSNVRRFFRESARRQGLEYEGALYALVPEEHLPAQIRNGWNVTRAIYTRMLELLTEKRIPMLGLVIPFSWTFSPHWEEFRVQTDAPITSDNATSRMEQILNDLAVPTIAMRREIAVSGEPPGVFFLPEGDAHLSQLGHSRVAVWILRQMEILDYVRRAEQPGSPD